MTFIVGVTGGIGSGKTAATDYLATLGITVVDADIVAREVVEPGQPALASIVEHFGNAILQPDGKLNRAALREIVFADPSQRKVLEGITHPAISAAIMQQLHSAQSPYVVLASPLLLETPQHTLSHRVLLIDSPEHLQLERTAARDNVSAEQVKAIIKVQMPRAEKQQRAHDIILNDGSLSALHKALDHYHLQYLELAKKHE